MLVLEKKSFLSLACLVSIPLVWLAVSPYKTKTGLIPHFHLDALKDKDMVGVLHKGDVTYHSSAPVSFTYHPNGLVTYSKTFTLKIGQSFGALLSNICGDAKIEKKIIQSFKNAYPLNQLIAGTSFQVIFDELPDHHQVVTSIIFKDAKGVTVRIEAVNNGESYKTTCAQPVLTKETRFVSGVLSGTFYGAALKQGVPANIVKEAIQVLSHHVNWQYDPKAGDPYELMYEVFKDEEGQVIKTGSLLYIRFVPKGQKWEMYRYQPKNGSASFYHGDGRSSSRTLLQTPLDSTKMIVTSKFGLRRHPIKNYTIHHKGVDYGAPTGTPVMAAGDGVVLKACYFGGYGNYILVQHSNGYKTAYAHLSKMFVKPGQRVSQRQCIGKVGNTGHSTGPHLHFEVLVNNRQIDPQKVKLIPTQQLNKKALGEFAFVKTTIEKKRKELLRSQPL